MAGADRFKSEFQGADKVDAAAVASTKTLNADAKRFVFAAAGLALGALVAGPLLAGTTTVAAVYGLSCLVMGGVAGYGAGMVATENEKREELAQQRKQQSTAKPQL